MLEIVYVIKQTPGTLSFLQLLSEKKCFIFVCVLCSNKIKYIKNTMVENIEVPSGLLRIKALHFLLICERFFRINFPAGTFLLCAVFFCLFIFYRMILCCVCVVVCMIFVLFCFLQVFWRRRRGDNSGW